MKKLISGLLTVFMLTALIAPATFASTDYYAPNSIQVVGGNNATDATDPVYGASTADGIKKFTKRNKTQAEIETTPSYATYHAGFIYNDTTAFSATQESNYVVFESDFAPTDMVNISVCRSGSSDATVKLTSGWIEGQWNTIRIVYETPTTDYPKGRAAFYVNGQTAMDFTNNINAFDNQYRFSFLFNNNEGTLYVKNYRMYGSDTNPGAIAMPTISDVAYNGTVELDYNSLVSSLTSAGNTVRVYSSDFTSKRAATDAVRDNDKIVVEDSNGIISTFTADVGDPPPIVIDPATKFAPDTVNVIGGNSGAAAEGSTVYGTASVDGIIKYIPRDDPSDRPYYAGFIWNTEAVVTATKTAKYIVFETDFAGKDIQNVGLYRSGQGVVAAQLTEGWNEGEWNTIRVVYENPTTDYSNGRTAYYLNGALVMDFTENTRYFDDQFRFNFMFNDAEGELFVKNYRMWATNDTAPGAIAMPAHPDATSNGYIVLDPDTDANTIVVTGCSVRIYSSDFLQQRTGTDKVQQDDKIVVENAGGIITTYTAQVDRETIVEDNTGASFNNGSGSIQTGIYGNSATDESLAITGNPSAIAEYENIGAYNYYAVKVSFVPTADLTAVSLCSPTDADSVASITGNWYYDEWNTAEFIYDEAQGKVKSYLNGELISETDAVLSDNKIGIAFDTGNSANTLYIDDYSVKIERNAPVVSNPSAAPETTYAPTSITTVGGSAAAVAITPVYGQNNAGQTYIFTPRNADLTTYPDRTHYYAGALWQADFAQKSLGNYIVFDMDFVAKDLIHIGLYTAGTKQVSQLATSGWKEGEWNNLRIVYENAPDGSEETGRTIFYINGEIAKEYSVNAQEFADNDFRLLFQFENAKGELYVNNCCMYYASEDPGATRMPRLSFCRDGMAFVEVNTTVQSIPTDRYNVRVYNNDFSVQRSGADVILQNDKIIVENKTSGVIATYTAQVGYISVVADSTGSAFGAGTAVTGQAGKAADDTSLEISGNPYAISPISTYSGYTYYLASVNFIPRSDLDAISLCSDTQTNILGKVENGWTADLWNNVTFVYDSVGGTVSSYINGTLVGTAAATSTIADNKIGIAFDTGSSAQTMYIDDYLVGIYRSAPVVAAPIVPPVGTVLGGNLMTADTVKVSDLKVQDTNLTVYEDNTYAVRMNDDELLFGNNIVVYVNDRNQYTYYNVLNNNLKIWGETALNATYDYDIDTITISGQLRHVGDVQITLEENGSVVYTEIISSNGTGGVSHQVTLGEAFLNKNYFCTFKVYHPVTGELQYTKELEFTATKNTDLTTSIGNINSAATATALAAILPAEASNLGLEDGTIKDNDYMANIIFAMKPEAGFDNNTFIAAYETAEGLAKLDQGSITFVDFLTNYENSLGADYITQYNAMSAAEKSDLALLFTNQLDPKPTFAELFEAAKWFSDYRTATSSVTTQTMFAEFAAQNSVSMANYNRIGNDYYQQKVYEKMYAQRANIATNASLIQSFNTAVTEVLRELSAAQQQTPQGGSLGGSSPSHSISTVEPQEIPGVTKPMFNDISNHWAKDYIEKLANSGIINGFEDGSFRPDASITRAEFGKILATIFKMSGSDRNIFTDVSNTDWFYGYVTALAERGIITGYDGKFAPQRNITRQDMAVMIYRALESAGLANKTANDLTYTDSEDVSDYAVAAVALLTDLGLLTGSDGCFNPLNTATRAEASAIFSRLLDYLG